MADVGRSTVEHGRSAESHALDAALINWGAWLASLPAPTAIKSIPPSPVVSEYLSRYQGDEDDLPPPTRSFSSEDAERFDGLIARTLTIREVEVMVCCFVARISSRDAAKRLTLIGHTCTHTTYRRWLDDALERLASAYHTGT